MSLARLRTAALALALVVLVAGCASSYNTARQKPGGPLAGHEVADDNNDGAYVSAGPISYQLEISRQLNPWSVEDRQFFSGLPKGTTAGGLNSQQLWYGVFLWAKNQHQSNHTTTDRFELVDTQGTAYYPIDLNPRLNPFAWTAQDLTPGTTEPGQNSIASQYENGKLLLFKLNTDIYENRPLILYILSPAGKRIGSISLDL